MALNNGNMVGEEGKLENTQEPTLSDLRNMLLDSQTSLASILRENRSLKEDIAGLEVSLQSQGREFNKIHTYSVSSVSSSNFS